MRTHDEKAQTIDFNRAKIISTYDELSGEHSESSAIVSRLTRRLQTTLDTRKLVEIYAEELKKVVNFDQFSFSDDSHLTFKMGARSAKHSCQFNLKLDATELGSIKLSRSTRFIEQEMAIVERLAGALVFPLQNAKLYHHALQSALKDELTGLGNKRALQADLHREAERALRHNSDLSIIILDADHFKQINDNYGHVAGDQVLKALARTLSSCARQSDMCFRYGGEEFLVILDNSNAQQANAIAERFRATIEAQNFYFGSQRVPVTASLGVASYAPGEPLENFIARADKALYQAKAQGRNRCVNYQELEASKDAELALKIGRAHV